MLSERIRETAAASLNTSVPILPLVLEAWASEVGVLESDLAEAEKREVPDDWHLREAWKTGDHPLLVVRKTDTRYMWKRGGRYGFKKTIAEAIRAAEAESEGNDADVH